MSKRQTTTTTFVCLLLLALAAGCSKGPARSKTDAIFVDWFKSHGETNVVVDAAGVSIAGNTTRLKASLYGMKKDPKGSYTAELEFRVRLPDNREIVEFVVGMGKTEEAAIKDSELNFLLTTFHVVYRSFINTADPHQTVHAVKIGGATREVMMGDIYVRGGDANKKMDFDTLRTEVCDAICTLPLSAQPHWIKIVYGQVPGKTPIVSAAVDNQEQAQFAATLQGLKWPASDHGYMLKQFIVVK